VKYCWYCRRWFEIRGGTDEFGQGHCGSYACIGKHRSILAWFHRQHVAWAELALPWLVALPLALILLVAGDSVAAGLVLGVTLVGSLGALLHQLTHQRQMR
jgi:hypothetical protein